MVLNDWSNGDLSGWETHGQTGFFLNNGIGGASGWEFGSNARDQALSRWITISPGEAFFFSAWAYSTGGTPNTNVIMVWQNGAGATNYVTVATQTAKGVWQRLSGTWTAPANAVRFRMLLQSDRASTGGNPISWTKPNLSRAMNGELIVNGAIYTHELFVDGVMITPKLAMNAATDAARLEGTATVIFGSSSYEQQLLASLNMNCQGGLIAVILSPVRNSSSSSPGIIIIDVRLNGTTVRALNLNVPDEGVAEQSRTFVIEVPIATNLIQLYAARTAGSANNFSTFYDFSILNLKR